MHDSYDIADLCRELEAKRKAMAVRTGVFTLFLGGAYILFGYSERDLFHGILVEGFIYSISISLVSGACR